MWTDVLISHKTHTAPYPPTDKTNGQATPVYTCDMCGQRGFRSPEEFGTHIVLCDGVPSGAGGG